MRYNRGSEWRRWDLHVHTISSYDYDYKGNDADILLTEALKTNNIAVVAITDHFVIDKTRIENLRKLAPEVVFFPGVELRTDKGDTNIHVILIFSLDIELDILVESFNVFKREKGKENTNNEKIYWDYNDIVDFAKRHNAVISIHAGRKTNGVDDKITNKLEHNQAVKEEYAKTVDIFEIGQPRDIDDYRTKVFPTIGSRPLIICSDNHDPRKYNSTEKLWIKADTTFDGLKQILNEHDRIFVGDIPAIKTKVQDNRTKYISNLSIKSTDGYDGRYGKWFNNIEIPINHELVAIIGNKGSGKSAIADIIALCGFSKNQEDFSFLNKKKFRDGRHANHFEATLTWESGSNNSQKLSDDNTKGEIELVKYLPQGYFERLTNEISTTEAFQKEIENVVFAHLELDDKIGYNSFEELITAKKTQIEKDIDSLSKNINELNIRIVKLENKLNTEYKQEIEKKIKLKKEELLALIEPVVVTNPNEDSGISEQTKTALSKIETLKTNLSDVEKRITIRQEQKQKLLIELRELKELKQEVEYKISDIKLFKEQKKPVSEKYNLSIDEIIKISFDLQGINKLIQERESKLNEVKMSLGEIDSLDGDFKPLGTLFIEYQQQMQTEQSTLDTPHKAYQNYLLEMKLWKEKKSKIIGNEMTIDTLTYYETELKYLDESLYTEIQTVNSERMKITKIIFDKKQEIIASYKHAKQELDSIIQRNADLLKDYKIDINAALCLSNSFNEMFFRNINRNVSGTFYSVEGGIMELKKIIQGVDFDNKCDVESFLNKLNTAIHEDQRDKYEKEKRFLSDQIKNPVEFYDYLFSLEFLDYNYQLMQGTKTLQQLSPGERGALLLVFYLLLDKNDIPLIIDQPEDNLDNNSVANILVPFIRRAKSKRQIIMVTHNPNLAVVSDAEQVIYVHIDKDNENLFTYKSGSIENREINDCIVKVLEGAMPAFNKRKQKYYE